MKYNTKENLKYFPKSKNFWIRINLTIKDDVEKLQDNLEKLLDNYSITVALMSNIEKGEKQKSEAYGKQHVHILLMFENYVKPIGFGKLLGLWEFGQFDIKQADNTPLDLKRMYDYLNKENTKEYSSELLYSHGKEYVEKRISKAKKETKDGSKEDVIGEIVSEADCVKLMESNLTKVKKFKLLVENGFIKFARDNLTGLYYMPIGKNIRADCLKQVDKGNDLPPVNYIIWDSAGTGKDQSVKQMLDRVYYWPATEKYMDNYNPDDFDIICIGEMSQAKLECIGGNIKGGWEVLKSMVCNTFQYRGMYQALEQSPPKQFIITTNTNPTRWLPKENFAEENKALKRRFKVVDMYEWKKINGWYSTTSKSKDGRKIMKFHKQITKTQAQDEDFSESMAGMDYELNYKK